MNRWTRMNVQPETHGCTEGNLYKILQVGGRAFPLYYGYYDECDRRNILVEPMPIYPDFLEEPSYTAEGFPFVTKMQDACGHYVGIENGCEECAECFWYRHGQELLGICVCPENKLADGPVESGAPHDG